MTSLLRRGRLVGLTLGLCCSGTALMTGLAADPIPTGATPARSTELRVFYSGHSLTDLPMPADVAAIAAGRGQRIEWNRQHIGGSTIQQRARGFANGAEPAGVDRDGKPIDLRRELGAREDAAPYDVLVITEQHALLAALLWNDSVGQLRFFQDRFVMGSPRGRTIFYEPWMSIDDRNDPARWIAYEKAAAPMWRCVAAGVNRSLEHGARTDRIVSLPAALALASLIEAAQDGALPGAASPREAVGLLISDDVHLTPLGAYFMGLLVYGTISPGALDGAWAPAGVPPEQASALQAFATRFLARPKEPEPNLEACGERLETSFASEFWSYFERATWRKEMGAVAASLRLLQEQARMKVRAFRGAQNPFLLH